MIKPASPLNESARAAALAATGILDTRAEERFDRYTRLACRLFDVPIALVSLVDHNRQWFKSRQGLEATETPRDISFCGHAILHDELLIVPDASQDVRFADNPLVCGHPDIRFYAGCPLRSQDGYALGTLCIIDRKPRIMTKSDIETLRDLGAMVAGELQALRLATMDELTGLSNRRAFNLIAEQALRMCARTDRNVSLLVIDMDDFKLINDRMGHAAGDQALVEFAGLLSTSFRESDVVARLGGDEFCVLLTDTNLEKAWFGLNRLRAAVETRNELPGRHYQLGFSAGVVQWDANRHDDIAALLHAADRLMYEQKSGSPRRDTVAVC